MAAEKKSDKTPEKDKEPTQGFDVQAFVRAEVQKVGTAVFNQISQQLANRTTGLDQLAGAYVKAVAASRDAHKNATNPHLRNQYADLGSVLTSVRESFLSNGLWLLQYPGAIEVKSDGNPYISMHGFLLHSSGQSLSFMMQLPAFTLSKDGKLVLNPQTSGSALSYARRYMWVAVAGITQTDDDGAEASYVPPGTGDTTAQGSAPQGQSAEAQMIERISQIPTFDALKALRDEANALKSKPVQAAYLARREAFLAEEQQ